MAIKKRGLGKNLNALLFTALGEESLTPADELKVQDAAKPPSDTENFIQELLVHQLQPGQYQPRQLIASEELESLAASVRAQGIIQPILVRPLMDNRFEIIAGERRWRAAQLAGLDKVPVVVRKVADQNAMAMALIENIQREDLNPLEEALAFERLAKEFSLTHAQISEIVGKSRTAITNSLRLLTLGDAVKLLLKQGALEVGHAKVLLMLKEPKQSHIAKIVVDKSLSVRETERLVMQSQNTRSGEGLKLKAKPRDPDIVRLQNALSDKLGAQTQLIHNQQGKGKIVIHYNSLDELDGVLAHLDPSLV